MGIPLKICVRSALAGGWGPAGYCCPLGGTGSQGTANNSSTRAFPVSGKTGTDVSQLQLPGEKHPFLPISTTEENFCFFFFFDWKAANECNFRFLNEKSSVFNGYVT